MYSEIFLSIVGDCTDVSAGNKTSHLIIAIMFRYHIDNTLPAQQYYWKFDFFMLKNHFIIYMILYYIWILEAACGLVEGCRIRRQEYCQVCKSFQSGLTLTFSQCMISENVLHLNSFYRRLTYYPRIIDTLANFFLIVK